uniref:Uncharacterized protein n=1 Tax=Chloropicon laureae TaxID=464258 RepID=A0A7S2Z5P6_9CHLO|mmetsp:Transcript_6460/g.16625  ORF Transcript_6460/g.16625 Transcript_6460/m.16625 type:complete len:104 (+) Transcript_6460:368-679(+)
MAAMGTMAGKGKERLSREELLAIQQLALDALGAILADPEVLGRAKQDRGLKASLLFHAHAPASASLNAPAWEGAGEGAPRGLDAKAGGLRTTAAKLLQELGHN